ncbi:hypothetical protein Tsubulata_050758, partial [Turnera subulata]
MIRKLCSKERMLDGFYLYNEIEKMVINLLCQIYYPTKDHCVIMEHKHLTQAI